MSIYFAFVFFVGCKLAHPHTQAHTKHTHKKKHTHARHSHPIFLSDIERYGAFKIDWDVINFCYAKKNSVTESLIRRRNSAPKQKYAKTLYFAILPNLNLHFCGNLFRRRRNHRLLRSAPGKKIDIKRLKTKIEIGKKVGLCEWELMCVWTACGWVQVNVSVWCVCTHVSVECVFVCVWVCMDVSVEWVCE